MCTASNNDSNITIRTKDLTVIEEWIKKMLLKFFDVFTQLSRILLFQKDRTSLATQNIILSISVSAFKMTAPKR